MSSNLAAIVDRVTPAVFRIVADGAEQDRSILLHKAMRANVEHSAQQLQFRSGILRDLIKNKKLKIVGAEYSIETGQVEFYPKRMY